MSKTDWWCYTLDRIFYWPHAQFDTSLLIQSVFMVTMQLALLKIGLDHRPPPSTRGGDGSVPFSGATSNTVQRPYNFWQWRSPKPCVLTGPSYGAVG